MGTAIAIQNGSIITSNRLISELADHGNVVSTVNTYYLNGKQVSLDVASKNQLQSTIKIETNVNENLLKIANSVSTESNFMDLIKNNLPDYTGLPTELKKKVDDNLVSMRSSTITINGVKATQDTAGDIIYTEDSAIGSMSISTASAGIAQSISAGLNASNQSPAP
jgi:hypothetical protein